MKKNMKKIINDIKSKVNLPFFGLVYLIVIIVFIIDKNVNIKDFILSTLIIIGLLIFTYLYSKYTLLPYYEKLNKKKKDKEEKYKNFINNHFNNVKNYNKEDFKKMLDEYKKI